MVEGLSGGWPVHLEALLGRLRQDGFSIGVAETLRLHQLLMALVDRGVPLEDPRRLVRLLGPVLCRSASEQEAFARHMEDWWPGPASVAHAPPEPLPAPAAALEEALAGVERRRWRLLRWLPTRPLALAISAVVLAAGVGGVVELRKRQIPVAPPARVHQPAPAGPPPKPPPPSAPLPPPAPRPSAPAEPPIGLARDDGLFVLPSELALLALVAVVLALVAAQGAVRLWWWRQARLVLQRLPLQGDPQLHRIALRFLDRDLVPLPDLHRIRRALNVWRRLPSQELDGAATVAASLRQGGWLCPRYGERRQRLSYLFLLDQESLADQQTRHLRAWLERLRLEGVLADWVCFQREPVFCHGPEGHGPLRGLAELAAQHPEAVAVVVADGERFFSPVDGTPRPWLRELAAWPRRAVLTPRPIEAWGALEAELAEHLPVLPASPEGLLRLGRWLEEAPSPPLDAKGVVTPPLFPVPVPAGVAPEPPLPGGAAAAWLDRDPPSPRVVSDLLERLGAFLGREGLFWLAACAVFPELHWTITAYLGQCLRAADGAPLLSHCPLPRLARLPWLRHGFMPDWLRLSLIQTLEPPREAAVRERLADLLRAALVGGEVGAAELRVATAHGQPLRRLLPPLLEQLRHRASPGSPLRDQLFLRFLQNRPLLAADAPESLRRLLREPPGQRWRSLRPWSPGGRELAVAGLVVLGLGGVGLVGVREVQRAWLEHLLRTPGAPALPGAEATIRLQRAITALGLSRSTLMRLGPDPELQRVEEALARESEGTAQRPFTLKVHQGGVWSAAFSVDGSRIVSAGEDGTVRVWDARSGRGIGEPLRGHQGGVGSAAFSVDGSRIVSAGEDGTVRVWDARSGTGIGEPLRGHQGRVWSAAFSVDGSRIVSAGEDGTVRVWDARSGIGIGEPLRGHQGGVGSAAFSVDGSRIVSAGEDGTVRVWDARSGRGIGEPLRGHQGRVWSAAFSVDGSRIVSAGEDGTVRVWNAKSGTEIGEPLQGHQGRVWSAAFSVDRSRIVSAGEYGSVVVWQAKGGKWLGELLSVHQGRVWSVAFSPDGSRIVSGGEDGTVWVWGLSIAKAAAHAPALKGRTTPGWRRTLPIACAQLEFSQQLNSLPWLNTARATCQRFVWSQRPRQGAGFPAGLVPLGPWAGAGALGVGGLAAWGLLARWQRPGRTAAAPPQGGSLHPTDGEGAPRPAPATTEARGGKPSPGLATGRDRSPSDGKGQRARAPAAGVPPKPAAQDPTAPSSPPPGQMLAVRVSRLDTNGRKSLTTWTVPTARLLRVGTDWQVERGTVEARGYREELGGGKALPMVEIPAGRFLMGSPPGEPERRPPEGPQHAVELERFFLGQTPITLAQWRTVGRWRERPGEQWGRKLEPNPPCFSGDNPKDSSQWPVAGVSWEEAMEFCSRLNQRTGRTYTLPSEAQWEYACRAGTTTPFHFGDTLNSDLANYRAYIPYDDGPRGESRERTTPVGLFPANAWGLQDMHGNVWEWCLDLWHPSYQGAPADGSAWLRKLHFEEGALELRLLRGGSWLSGPGSCRSAYRIRNHPDDRDRNVGFRVCCLPQDVILYP